MMVNQLCIDRMREWLRLDPDTGKLFWRVTRGGGQAGTEAGCVHISGYRQVRVGGCVFKTHRVVFALAHGCWPSAEIDHINLAKTDNRPCNLREASCTENQHNRGLSRNNTSGVKGVSWDKTAKKWRARILAYGRAIHLGLHDDIDLAELVVSESRRKLHGEFARQVS